MQFSSVNNVKIYNLSAGKSLPEWLTDRKRRKLEQKDVDIRRRIQLIQDFDMPDVSNTVDISPDGNYIFATGTYKPTLKCYDTNDLSLKFARGLDADVIKMHILSDDYSKFVLLEEERYVEFHAAYGRYFRMRIPKFGRDLAMHRETSELYIVGSGPDVYRLNLEAGRFMRPLVTESDSLLSCSFNAFHQLFVCATDRGKVEAWDPRDRTRVARLDIVPSIVDLAANEYEGVPFATMLKFRDALQLAVGTSTGQILLYDLRSRSPVLTKDHLNGLPIQNLHYSTASGEKFAISMDSRAVKIWHNDTGKPLAAIEPDVNLHDLAVYPDSGLLFLATESPKMLQYFVPSLGPAPKWCSYLETITEELEETEQPAVFDDYKFVTNSELENLGLGHLMGTNLLRAYMHGYFIHVKLYNKARTFARPFAYDQYVKEKIGEKLYEERNNIVAKINNKKENGWQNLDINNDDDNSEEEFLPSVNQELAKRLMTEQSEAGGKRQRRRAKTCSGLLADERFSHLFTNTEFEIDVTSEQYQLMNPALKKLKERRVKTGKNEEKANDNLGMDALGLNEKLETVNFEGDYQDGDSQKRPASPANSSSSCSSSDNDRDFANQLKQTHKELAGRDKVAKKWQQRRDNKWETNDAKALKNFLPLDKVSNEVSTVKKRINRVNIFELRAGEDFRGWQNGAKNAKNDQKLSLGHRALLADAGRLGSDKGARVETTDFGGKSMTFTPKQQDKTKREQMDEKNAQHIRDRRRLRRKTGRIVKDLDGKKGRKQGKNR